jgi:hypothetical protein
VITDWIVGWDATGAVLDAIVCRESALKAELDHWDVSREICPPSPSGWAATAGDADGWGMEERSVSIQVRSQIVELEESSACRFRLFPIDLN